MEAGLKLEYSLMDEPAKIRVKAWNDTTSCKTECYVSHINLGKFADAAGKLDPGQCENIEFGKVTESRSYCNLSLQTLDQLGHLLVEVKLGTGDYESFISEATIRFKTDIASIDRFAKSIKAAIENYEGTALLAGEL